MIAHQLIRSCPLAHPLGFPSMSFIPMTSIVEDLQAALAQFAAVTDAKQRPGFQIATDLKR
jgi:hypothetical protein